MKYLSRVGATGVILCLLASPWVGRAQGAELEERAKLIASDGEAYDRFSRSVSVSGDLALIGVPYDDDVGRSSGAAYVYRFDGSAWVEVQKLTASDGQESDDFGYSVSLDGDVACADSGGES